MSLRLLFLINAVYFIALSLYLILQPGFLFPTDQPAPAYYQVVDLFILAGIFIGALSLIVYRYFEYNDLTRITSLLFISFHLILALRLQKSLEASPFVFIAHFVLSLSFLGVYFKEKSFFNKK